jgi:uncharacterized membrane protein
MSRLKTPLLWLMGIFYIGNGVNHFVNSEFYLPLMPPYLPLHLELIYLSGLAELVLGIAVLVASVRRLAAWGIILLLIAIFPANVHVALYNVSLGGAEEGAGIWNWVRLPFQAVFVAWAWWYTSLGSPPARETP